jgi:hypothetical protein
MVPPPRLITQMYIHSPFLFSEDEDVKEFVEERKPGLNKRITDGLAYLDIIDCLEYLEVLLQEVHQYNGLVDYAQGRTPLYFPHVLHLNVKLVDARIDKLTPAWFKEKVEMRLEDVVNGYKLDNDGSNPVEYPEYLRLCKIWDGVRVEQVVEERTDTHYAIKAWVEYAEPMEELTKEEFIALYVDTACTDWNKQDEHGESFGGFWDFPEGTYEKTNAFELTGRKNGEMLWALPFPKRFLVETINIGCKTRDESVAFSNMLGVWVTKKRLSQL